MKNGIFTICFLGIFAFQSFSQELIQTEYLQSISLQELQNDYGPLMENGVDLYKVWYTTPDVQGVVDTASGLLVIPDRPSSELPLICVQHGTVSSKTDVPSNLQGAMNLGWYLVP